MSHPQIKAVGFTGSRTGGFALMRIASDRTEPIPVFAEMSSINPVIVLPGALQSRTLNLVEKFVRFVAYLQGRPTLYEARSSSGH